MKQSIIAIIPCLLFVTCPGLAQNYMVMTEQCKGYDRPLGDKPSAKNPNIVTQGIGLDPNTGAGDHGASGEVPTQIYYLLFNTRVLRIEGTYEFKVRILNGDSKEMRDLYRSAECETRLY